MLRDTPNTEALIVEYGFLDNANDANRLKNNYKNYALSVVQAILEYKGIVPEDIIYYNVKPNDTLYSIAKKFNMSVDKLKQLNNLKSNIIQVNQKLLVKDDLDNTDSYIVKKGDTLYGIAKKYNTTVNDIVNLNNLKTTNLSIGQKLIIPKPVNTKTYIVKKGDTLYSIAKNNNTTVNAIKTANNLNSNILSIGKELIIP